MSILVNDKTKVLVQGISGKAGAFHAEQMIKYGTNVVGGISPSKQGLFLDKVPLFASVREAQKQCNANASIIFVPAPFAKDAILESAYNGISLITCITEGIPTLDMVVVLRELKSLNVTLIGPNCPGIITPDECKMGIMPGDIHKKGSVGVVSRSGTLTYEAVHQLTNASIGQSTCIGIGGDPLIGTDFIDCLKMFEEDDKTKAIVLIGEIGGNDEELAADYIKSNVKKPVVSFIAGLSAPKGKRMGHAGAIISGGAGTAQSKITALKRAGAQIAQIPSDIPLALKSIPMP